MKGPTDHQYETVAVGAGRRTIGQLAGNEIHLEIEDVLDKKVSLGDLGFELFILTQNETSTTFYKKMEQNNPKKHH